MHYSGAFPYFVRHIVISRWRMPMLSALLATLLCCPPLIAAPDTAQQVSKTPPPTSTRQLDPLTAPEPEKDLQALSAVIDRYEQAIDEQEAIGGAYDLQLSEQLFSLGAAYTTVGRHADAEQVYKDALHISRVNNGIYSLSQAPMLRGIISSLEARNMTLEAGEYLNQLNWLHLKAYGQDDPRLLPILFETASWHLSIYNRSKKSRQDLTHLASAHNLFNTTIGLAKKHHQTFQTLPVQLTEILRAIANTSYQLAMHYTRYQSLPEEDPFARQKWFGYEPSDTDGSLRYNYYKNGRIAHSEIISLAAAENRTAEQAEAYAELGDWYLLFGRKNSAAQSYQQAYELANTSPQKDKLVEYIFGRPLILPVTQTLAAPRYPESTPWAEIEMDINVKGRVNNIKVVNHSDSIDSAEVEKYARANVRPLTFRPRYENGIAVVANAVPLKISMPDFGSNK